jgi:hypothetical protein
VSEKALKLIPPVSKHDRVVASFKEKIPSGIIQPAFTLHSYSTRL